MTATERARWGKVAGERDRHFLAAVVLESVGKADFATVVGMGQRKRRLSQRAARAITVALLLFVAVEVAVIVGFAWVAVQHFKYDGCPRSTAGLTAQQLGDCPSR